MSRCFPFPPPGYEKKLNLDDANLLAKAKHKEKKEKKHKKDKKDKEKKEGKEKDKDRSKKKEKKEKHRDKNPEKNNPGEEKRIEGHVGSSSLQSNHLAESSYVQELARRIKDDDGATGRQIVDRRPATTQKQAEPPKNVVAINVINKSERKETSKGSKSASKNNAHEKKGDFETKVRRVAIVHSLGGMEPKRVDTVKPIEKDVTKAVEWKEKENPHVSVSKGGDKSVGKDERKVNRQVEHFNGNNFVSNRAQNCHIKENGFVQEFEGRGQDGYAAPKGQFVDKNTETDQKRAGFMGHKNVDTNQKRENVGRMVESNNISYFSEGKGVSNNGNGIYNNASAQIDKIRAPKVSFVHNISRAAEQKRVEGLDTMEKGIKRTADGKEKGKREGKTVERAEVKVRESSESNKKMFRIKELVREPVDGTKSSLLKDINTTPAAEESAKKRKLPEINGFLHDNEIRPSKLQRPTSSSGQPPIVNGRKLDEASSIITPPSAPKEKGIAGNNRIQVKKEHKLNGVTDPLQSTVSLSMSASNHRSSASAPKEKGNAVNHKPEGGDTKINGFSDPCQTTVKLSTSSSASKSKRSHKTPSVKPPHPDSKYLSEILSIPKIEDLVQLDTDDWLFNCSQKKPKVSGNSEAETQLQVWEKALVLESADISALPYVIPY